MSAGIRARHSYVPGKPKSTEGTSPQRHVSGHLGFDRRHDPRTCRMGTIVCSCPKSVELESFSKQCHFICRLLKCNKDAASLPCSPGVLLYLIDVAGSTSGLRPTSPHLRNDSVAFRAPKERGASDCSITRLPTGRQCPMRSRLASYVY